mgnify:CR=1 FL=1
MLNIVYSIIYGIIEGITEWLPISSTGHIILAKNFLKFKGISEGFFDMFDVVIQLGAILAVVVLYFKNIWPLKKHKSKHGDTKIVWDKNILILWAKILVACVPAAIVGLLFDDILNEYLYNSWVVATMLIVVGIAFIVIENKKKDMKPRVNDISELTYKDAIIIGLFQLIAAIFPGTSRSGATIIGALLIGISRTVAAEYTFYLAIPVMFGASLLKILKFGLSFTGMELAVLLVGMVVAFLVSIFVIKFLMNYIKKHDFKVFGWYRIVLGIIVIILLGVL